jgi:hypothetical protein
LHKHTEDGFTAGAGSRQILKNGTPDGRLRLRNAKCGTPEADGILTSADSGRAEPGFGQGGGNVADVDLPLTGIPAP